MYFMSEVKGLKVGFKIGEVGEPLIPNDFMQDLFEKDLEKLNSFLDTPFPCRYRLRDFLSNSIVMNESERKKCNDLSAEIIAHNSIRGVGGIALMSPRVILLLLNDRLKES